MGAKFGLWWALFAASVKMFVRNRLALFFSLFLPLVIMLIFGVLNFEGSTTVELGIVDEARQRGGHGASRGARRVLVPRDQRRRTGRGAGRARGG